MYPSEGLLNDQSLIVHHKFPPRSYLPSSSFKFHHFHYINTFEKSLHRQTYHKAQPIYPPPCPNAPFQTPARAWDSLSTAINAATATLPTAKMLPSVWQQQVVAKSRAIARLMGRPERALLMLLLLRLLVVVMVVLLLPLLSSALSVLLLLLLVLLAFYRGGG